MILEDPRNGNAMSVSKVKNGNNRGNISSRTASRAFYISRDNESSYHWVSTLVSGVGTVGGVVISLVNDSSDKNLYIDDITMGSDTALTWNIYKKLNANTPAGTTVTSINLNAKGSDSSDSKCFGNALVTGISNTSTSKYITRRNIANSSDEVSFQGAMIFGRGDGLNIELSGNTVGSGIIDVAIHGHFE